MAVSLKFVILTAGTLLLLVLTPILWASWGTHAYFETGRCTCGYTIFGFIKDNAYCQYAPAHGMPAHEIYALHATNGQWEASALDGQAVVRFRLQGGDLWENYSPDTNWTRFPRVYNPWRVWLTGLFAKPPHQKITCVNNLKQIGLALKTWSLDNGDLFPFDLSTNGGGTREFLKTGVDGFDDNSCWHFMVMSNELTTPLVLVCPQDRARKAATNFISLRPKNVTYRLRSGSSTNTSNSVVAICPVDGNTLYADGSVKEGAHGKP